MADKRFNIVFNAEMEIGGIKKALDEINKITSNTSLNLPKGISSGLTKTISGIRSELLKLEGLQGAEPNAKNASAITKAYDSIFTKFQSLQALMGDLGKDIKIDPKKFFPDSVLDTIKNATKALDDYHKKLREGPQSEQYKNDTKNLKEAKRDQETALSRQSAANLAKKEAEELKNTYASLAKEKEKAFNEAKGKKSKADSNLAEINKEIQKREELLKLKQKEAALETQKKLAAATKEGTKERIKQDKIAVNMQAEVDGLKAYANEVQASGESLDQLKAKAEAAKGAAAAAATDAAAKEKEYQAALNGQAGAERDILKHENAYKVAGAAAQEAAARVKQYSEAVKQTEQSHESAALKTLVDTIRQPLEQMNIKLPIDVSSVEQVNNALSNLNADAITKIEKAFADAGVNAKDFGLNLENLKGNTDGFKGLSANVQRASDDMAMLQSRFNYFFSSLNMVNLFKRAIKGALNTVKELDAVMTETAVVTDFTVGDMWNKLPEYASQASALGASIKDLYSATTLYYQQGLQSNAAMGVGVETMKMARIAGMEAAEATQAMTAALRGFNMEVNEANAQVVNDVYSELAAITAADTSQIATAMTKTASIASSANMEFETTAALLAQIIETTQEAPETAGTAMKTIIARFTEVKKLFKEGQLTGEDEEGEAININKIDAALKTVGISLKDFLNGSKGIDDIFLELASKWDTLDLATQRYIATTAAGSRQQSRFIAMMSNYGRTMELVDAAQNSSGASQEQFDKTLESMEAKLQKLSNAWNQFLMGISNNEVLKFGVDLLTKFLETINSLTDGLSGGKGLSKSLINLLTVVGALKGGRALLGGAFQWAGAQMGLPQAQGAKTRGLMGGMFGGTSTKQAQLQGEKDGQAYMNGFQRAAQAKKTGGSVLGAFFGEKGTITGSATDKYFKKNQAKFATDYLAQAYELNQENLDFDIGKVTEAFETGGIEAANKAIKDMGGTIEGIQLPLETLKVDFQSVGMAVMGVGTAVTLLGGLFNSLGLEGVGETFQKIGGIITGVGSALMMLSPILNALNISVSATGISFGAAGAAGAAAGTAVQLAWWPLILITLALVATFGVLVAIMKNTPSAQLEAAKEAAENAEKAAKNAASAYEELQNSIAGLDEKLSSIENLTRGTEEWKKEVQALNEEILTLVDQNPELAAFVKNDRGVLSLDKSGDTKNSKGQTYEDVMREQEARVGSLGVVATSAKINALQKEFAVMEQTYLSGSKGISDYRGINTFEAMLEQERNAASYETAETYPAAAQDPALQQKETNKTISDPEMLGKIARDMAKGTIKGLKLDDSSESRAHNRELISAYLQSNYGQYSESALSALTNDLAMQTSQLTSYGHKLLNQDLQIELQNDQLMSQVIEQAGITEGAGKTVLEQLDSSLLKNIYDEEYETARDEYEGKVFTQEDKDRYAELMGYTHISGRKFRDKEGNEIKASRKEIMNALASADASEASGTTLTQLASQIQGKTEDQRNLMLEMLSQDGATMSKDTVMKYGAFDENGQFAGMRLDQIQAEVDDQITAEEHAQLTSALKEKYGYKQEDIEGLDAQQTAEKIKEINAANKIVQDMGYEGGITEYAEAFKMDVSEAVEQIKTSFEAGGDAFLDQRKTLVKKMSKYTKGDAAVRSFDNQATILAILEKQFGDGFADMLSEVFTSLEAAGNQELTSMGFALFEQAAWSGDKKGVEDISEFIGEVNWGNSIEAVSALNREIEYGTGAAKAYAQAMMNANLDYFDIGSQTEALVQSDQFDEIQNELDGILATTEEISAANVKDLAKSFGTLDRFLKNTGMSASGMAKALTAVQKGTIKIDQLTSSVMAALSNFNSLEDTVTNVLDELNNLDLGIDENQIAEKTKGFAETLNQNIQKGAYGNSQNDAILDYMFGPGWDRGLNNELLTGEAYVNRMKEYAKFLSDNSENFASAWTKFAEGKDIDGGIIVDRQDEIRKNLESKGITLEGEGPQVKFGENGGVEISEIGNMTTKELTSWMAEAYGVTENLAEMMLGDLSNYSTDIKPILEENDYQAGIEAALTEAGKAKGWDYGEHTLQYGHGIYGKEKVAGARDVSLIDESEIRAIEAATGRAYDDIKADFESKGALITNFFDKDGALKQGEDLLKEFNKIYAGSEFSTAWQDQFVFNRAAWDDYTKGYTGEMGTAFDVDKLDKELAGYNFTEAQNSQIKNQVLNEAIERGGGEARVSLTLDDGSVKEVTAKVGDTMESLESAANFELETDQLTNSIVAAFEKVENFEIKFSEDSAANAKAVLENLDTDIELNAQTTAMSTELNKWMTKNGKQTISLNIVPNQKSISVSGEGGSISFSISALASGIKNAPSSFDALTGEEGPELVQTKNGAYLVGQNGPEMAHINKGDTVYTAEETKKILKGNNPSLMPRFNDGYDGGGTISAYTGIINGPSGKRKVGSGDEKKKDIDIDKLYNILADIEEALRTREKLEREYIRILDHVVTSARDLVIASNNQIAHLEDEKARQEKRKEARIAQSNTYMEENADYKKYAWVETRDDGERVVQIDWDAINNISDDKEKENVQEYLSNIENFEDDINEAEDAIFEIDESVKEIKNRGKDEMLDFENQVKDALVNERQKEIDKLSEINDSINDTNSRLLEAMSYSIEQQRQARENDKTEQEISDKQRQLAYLQQDTSGANALDIMKLQKEIDEAQEDYTDTLIDQKISELQKQNDDAATQRQQQIDIAQAQLDHYVESGQVWNDVYNLMEKGIDANGMIIDGSELMNKLKADQDYVSMSHLGKLAWAEELIDTVAQGLTWLQIGRQTEDIDGLKGKEITFTTKDGKSVTGTVGEDGKVTAADGTVYDKVYQNYDGSYTTSEEWIDPATIQQQVEETVPEEPPKPEITEDVLRGVASAIWRGDLGWGTGSERMSKLTEIFGADNAAKVKRYVEKHDYKQFDPSFSIAPEHSYDKMKETFGTSGETYEGSWTPPRSSGPTAEEKALKTSQDWDNGEGGYNLEYLRGQLKSDLGHDITDEELKKWIQKGQDANKEFATGGLADFTGPAWLDGTKARPEYVLNADQTKAFFNMVNVLESLQHGPTSRSSTENNGDINLDIDINVESIGSDYDVEQVADTIKRMIANDARYRNNNTVNLTR